MLERRLARYDMNVMKMTVPRFALIPCLDRGVLRSGSLVAVALLSALVLACVPAAHATEGGPATAGKAADAPAGDAGQEAHGPEPVEFAADDGVRVFADLYRGPRGKAGPVMLLFHQAGSNSAEYEPIAPRLVEMGYTCLALDQRSGGRRWGRNNRTVMKNGPSTDFESAHADLEAALAWVRRQGYGGPVIAVGSSYTAALVFRLASESQGLAAIVAFSPGEYFGDGNPVRGWASKVTVPIYATSGEGKEVFVTRQIIDASPSTAKSHYVPRVGVHGASTLRTDRNPQGAAENWSAFEAFLSAHGQAQASAR